MNFTSRLKRLLLPLLMLLAAFGTNDARASHYAASDIYVDYIGTGPTNRLYRVTLIQ
jgi:hypothetical protein